MFEHVYNSRLSKAYYDSLMDPDNVTGDWFLTKSFYPVASILSCYLLVVLWLGPRHMKNRPAYPLETIMRFYNMAQMMLNAFLTYHIFSVPWYCIFNTFCNIEEELKICKPWSLSFLQGNWLFLVIKMLDLFDTVFIVLRKNDSHLTFLHVYHHVAMVLCTWISIYYFKTPQGTVQASVNMIVHFVMYGYYFLSTFPALKPYLWWKRHLTKLQLGQFVVVLVYLSYLYINACDIPPLFTIMWLINVAIIASLFVNFYVQSYLVKTKLK